MFLRSFLLFSRINHKKPYGYWNNKNNKRKYLQDIALKLNLKTKDDWNKIKRQDIINLGGYSAIKGYNNLYSALVDLLPEYNWDIIPKRKRKPTNFWKDKTNSLNFLNELSNKYLLYTPLDWCNKGNKIIIENKGQQLLLNYNNLYNLLKTHYPDKDWTIFYKYYKFPISYWYNKDNRIDFINYIMKYNNLKSQKHIKNLSLSLFKELGGKPLLDIYKNIDTIIDKLYIDYNNIEIRKPRGYWKDINNQRLFLDNLAIKLNITNKLQWNNITRKQILNNGGKGLLSQYSCISNMLSTLYPSYSWDLFKRHKHPNNYWNNNDNINKFIQTIKTKYYIQSYSDWYRISSEQIKNCGGSGLLRKYGSLSNMLLTLYPNIKWDISLLDRRDKRSSQRWLYILLKEIFNNNTLEIIEDYIHPSLLRESGLAIEFDIYIPSLLLAIEYHGEHHYYDLPAFGNLELYQTRDNEKYKLCKNNNIKLIIISYKWNQEKESLKKELLLQQPFLNKYIS